MIPRVLEASAFSEAWGRQMRFIAGPRQSGKTTLAQSFLSRRGDASFYYNWDEREQKLRFRQKSDFLKEDLLNRAGRARRRKRWVCYDEIHKMPKWKDILKGHFDAHEKEAYFIVTGSARLDFFRRSGDSLAGRYFLFHLFPLNLFELTRRANQTLPFYSSAADFVENQIAGKRKSDQKLLESLLVFGGFPEPFLKGEESFHRLWQRNYLDRLVREDLRDLTRIGELENVAALVSLLPERIGSPLSVNSLREDLFVSHQTVKNYLSALRLCYFLFELPAYSRKISRALKKERKVYFHDWSLCPEPAKRFENYVAAELYSWTQAWQDGGRGSFEVDYLRTREGRECDFLIVKDSRPWLLLEAKLKAEPIPASLYHFSKILGGIPVVQLVQEKEILRAGREGDCSVSASRFFSA